jgi:hypothetical protein
MPIPFLSTPDKALTATTQELLPIAEIVDGVVIYKTGGASLIMESTSLNFGLLSEREQKAVIASYAGLLNSFNFPVQIVVRSQKKDISIYMDFLSAASQKIKVPKLKVIMEDYKKFIEDAIKKKNVLSKKFYIVILFSQYELGITKSFMSSFKTPSSKPVPIPFPKPYVIRKAKVSLFPKRDHLIRQARRLGITLHQLSNTELINLFYNIYNPEPPIKERDLFGG